MYCDIKSVAGGRGKRFASRKNIVGREDSNTDQRCNAHHIEKPQIQFRTLSNAHNR